MPIIEINGQRMEVEAGLMIIQVADKLGVHIPRFCYHKKLSIAANCRMCLVDVERVAKPLPACATPISEGMKIWTQSEKARDSQKNVMEFLLINHPLDCPVCDQGGECELQDLSMGYGKDTSRYTDAKRVVKDKDLGALIQTDMTRCIHCTRCVRFGEEIAGMREMGGAGRGECTEIGTYIEQDVKSEVSGNIIDLCPVGALTSKPFLFSARGWELKQVPSVSPHDCLGTNIYLHTRRNQVMRVVPRENEHINETWISDRDRFSYEALMKNRIQMPRIKENGKWRNASWEEAIKYSADRLSATSGKNLGALISPNATVEEHFALQKLVRRLGSHNIDHRLWQSDFRHQEMAPAFPNSGVQLSEFEHQSCVLLIGSNIRTEQPLLSLKLRKMALKGGTVLAINPIDFSFNFELSDKRIMPAGDLVDGLAKLVKLLLGKSKHAMPEFAEWLESVEVDEQAKQMARFLTKPGKKLVIFGALANQHPSYSQLIALGNGLATLINAKVAELSVGANAAGAWIAGTVPHRLPGVVPIKRQVGLNAQEMLDANLKNYLLFDIEPELDHANTHKLVRSLKAADFVCACAMFENTHLDECADVILPITPFTETEGTWVNTAGTWQSFAAAVAPFAQAKPGWQVLTLLNEITDHKKHTLTSLETIRDAVEKCFTPGAEAGEWGSFFPKKLEPLMGRGKIHISEKPLYASDAITRRAKSLQQHQGDLSQVRVNSAMQKLWALQGEFVEVTSDKGRVKLPLVIDDAIADHCVAIPMGLDATKCLGEPYAEINVKPCLEMPC